MSQYDQLLVFGSSPMWSPLALFGSILSIPSALSVKADLDKLQGTWVGVMATVRGKQMAADVGSWQLIIKGTTVERTTGPRKSLLLLERLEPLKNPKRMEFRTHPNAHAELDQIPGLWQCLYEVDGDKLKLCFTQKRGAPYPDKIDKDSTESMYMEWKRMKPK